MFNVSIAGRLTKDAEYKKAGAYDMAIFTVAVSHGKERTSFIDCQVWGKKWELIVQAYKKGSLVAVSGQGEYSKFTTEDGVSKNQFRLNVDQFVLPERRMTANVEEETATIPF